jgi:spore coat protein U-like protein
MTARFGAVVAAVAILLLAMETRTTAQLGLGCTVEASPVAFGTYDVFANTPATSSGSITVRCTLGIAIAIALSPGGSGTYAPRRMQGSTHTLAYNLHTDASGSTVWGDGTGGTSTAVQVLQALVPVVRTVHARVPARQDVPPGIYGDSVVATIAF